MDGYQSRNLQVIEVFVQLEVSIDASCQLFQDHFRKNQGNVQATREALLNIVPHPFGEHDNCGTCCNYNDNPEKYTHKKLPGGKALFGAELRASLMTIFTQFANNAEKLAPCGSSQGNESLNMVCCSKTTKVKHYGSWSSNDFRIAAAICQKNLGTSCIERVNKHLQLSPLARKPLMHRRQKDRVRKLRAAKAKTIAFKRQRRQLFKARSSANTRTENKEGITYESNCAFDIGIDFLDAPAEPSINSVLGDSTKVVYFDIKTTSLRKTDEIIQIAAKIEEKEFNAFIVPIRGIPTVVSALTGLEVRSEEMYMNSIRVETTPPGCALTEFISFLKAIGPSIILAAHNGS